MAYYIGMNRKARMAYGFDDVAIVPGDRTINPDEVDVRVDFGGVRLEAPVLASAMDGVVDVAFAVEMGRLGGMAVLNLEGVQTRYEDPSEVLAEIAEATDEEATRLIQRIYDPPVRSDLIARRIEEMKRAGIVPAVSSIPQRAVEYLGVAREAGAGIFFVQSTVAAARHVASAYKTLDLAAFCRDARIPVVVGNCVTYETALELMAAGPAALLVGIGPGAACTSREVLGVGVPQVTSTVDCAAARDMYYKQTGRYVSIVTDGGMTTSGDVCKAFASGADAVMIGSAFARAQEAPGRGFHWGMATPNPNLPRGTRVRVGTSATLRQILFGPSNIDDGSQNLVGALRLCMGSIGAATVRAMQTAELIVAPAMKTEGKAFQRARRAAAEGAGRGTPRAARPPADPVPA